MEREAAALPAPAKLNLRLHITGQRADGMHLLQGEMVLIDFADTVYLTPRTDGAIARDWRHPQVSPESDLAVLAAQRLQAAARCRASGVTIKVDKKIPVGGGLGGGSSNAATVLMGLNRLWRLNLGRSELLEIAAALGADVPFFLRGAAATVGGIGDEFAYKKAYINSYLLVFPPVAALTEKVYREYRHLTTTQKTDRIPPPFGKSDNDLTAAATRLYPDIVAAAKALYDATGEARLSGSGSTVFAAFADRAQAQQAQARLPAAVSSAVATALPRHPLDLEKR